MADVKQCDGCGKLSPDEKGLYIANDWVSVKIHVPERKSTRDISRHYDVCKECFGASSYIELNTGFPSWNKK